MSTTPMDANTVIKDWPEDSRTVTAALITKYGPADIITGKTSVAQARQTYVDTMLAFREKKPTPYMTELQFKPQPKAGGPDTALVSTDQLKRAAKEHKTTIPVGYATK